MGKCHHRKNFLWDLVFPECYSRFKLGLRLELSPRGFMGIPVVVFLFSYFQVACEVLYICYYSSCMLHELQPVKWSQVLSHVAVYITCVPYVPSHHSLLVLGLPPGEPLSSLRSFVPSRSRTRQDMSREQHQKNVETVNQLMLRFLSQASFASRVMSSLLETPATPSVRCYLWSMLEAVKHGDDHGGTGKGMERREDLSHQEMKD